MLRKEKYDINTNMLKLRSYKFRFYPTAGQIQQLTVEFGNARWVWNHALSMRQKAYSRRGANMNYIAIGKHLTKLKSIDKFSWLADSTACAATQKLIDLDTAYKNFFGKRAKFPRFKKRGHAQSVRYQLDQRNLHSTFAAGELLKLPKLGEMDIRWSCIPGGTPKMVTISKHANGKYYVSFACEEHINFLPKTGKEVGLDFGITDVVVTSDGWQSGAPKFTKAYAKKLAHAQKDLSRKTKGSGRWIQQRLRVANIHAKIGKSRRDFLHKLTTKLVREFDIINIEDLNVSGMLKNHKLAKAIADVSFFELRRQLEYKCDWYGKELTVIDRWFPSTKMCSGCGQLHEMPLAKRTMECDCGLTINRDVNAAINIKAAGNVARGERSSGFAACAA